MLYWRMVLLTLDAVTIVTYTKCSFDLFLVLNCESFLIYNYVISSINNSFVSLLVVHVLNSLILKRKETILHMHLS